MTKRIKVTLVHEKTSHSFSFFRFNSLLISHLTLYVETQLTCQWISTSPYFWTFSLITCNTLLHDFIYMSHTGGLVSYKDEHIYCALVPEFQSQNERNLQGLWRVCPGSQQTWSCHDTVVPHLPLHILAILITGSSPNRSTFEWFRSTLEATICNHLFQREDWTH